jgi:hypothetical protein
MFHKCGAIFLVSSHYYNVCLFYIQVGGNDDGNSITIIQYLFKCLLNNPKDDYKVHVCEQKGVTSSTCYKAR